MRPARVITEGRVAIGVFFLALLVYLANGSLSVLETDSAPNALLPASLLGDGDLAFSPFEMPFLFLWSTQEADGPEVPVQIGQWTGTFSGSGKSYAQHYQEGRLKFNGSLYVLVPTIRERSATGEPLFVGAFGPTPGLAAFPLALAAHLAGVRLAEDVVATALIARLTASALIAASAALIYLTAIGFVSPIAALVISGAYAFGTCAWAISSQYLWQQTPEIFFLALGILCLMRARTTWVRGAAAGFALSAAAACRPTALLVAIVAAGWLLFTDRKALAAFVPAAIAPALWILSFNAHYFGAPFDFGQLAAGARVAQFKTGSPELWQTPLWLGAAGLLLSPSRGLLIYSPFLAAAFAGAFLAWKDPRYRAFRFLTVATVALWIPAFLWFDWWGGWTYGYRPIIDTAPLLALLCLPAVATLSSRAFWRVSFALALAWSIFVQVLGAFAYSAWGWNDRVIDASGTRANIDLPAFRDRLWSFRDWQIGYLIANFSQARAERGR